LHEGSPNGTIKTMEERICGTYWFEVGWEIEGVIDDESEDRDCDEVTCAR